MFAAIDNNFDLDKIHFEDCVSLSVDNASTIVEKRNSHASCFKDSNSKILFSVFPCHLAHITTSHVNYAFSEVLGLNVKNVCLDIFYWFDKSSK